MVFTLAQLREAVGLSVTTYRHWQETLPVLAKRTGRTARFSFADLVAVAVLRCAVDDIGLKISQFTASADVLFTRCNALTWVGQTDAYAIIGPNHDQTHPKGRRDVVAHRVAVARGDLSGSITRAAVVIPLDPIADQLRSLLFGFSKGARERQASLPFPPVSLGERPHPLSSTFSSSGKTDGTRKRLRRRPAAPATSP